MAIGATIPANLIQRIIPLLIKQSEQLTKNAAKFTDQIMQLNSKVKCSDPQIKQLKQDLQKIYDAISRIKQGLNSINNITPVITTISTVASTLKTIQLAIPAVPGVPTGPITELINTFDNLGTNAKSSTSSLQGLISTINIRLDMTNKTLAVGLDKLTSICNTETFAVTLDISNELDEINRNINYDSIAPTQFYTELNVSEDDIQNRIELIEDLLTQQLNVLQNLKEAPSKVLSNTIPPTADIGDNDDYYIDTNNQKIYGPKTDMGWGVGINI